MASYPLVQSDRPLRTCEREEGKVRLMRFMITWRILVQKGNELVPLMLALGAVIGVHRVMILEDLGEANAEFERVAQKYG